MGRLVLVTGANGFIAGAAARAFLRRGWRVRGSTRGAEAPAGVERVVVGGLGPDTDWAAALAGVDVVVHAAARVHDSRAPDDDPVRGYAAVNTAATRALAQAARRAGVRRLVFVSTIGVNGHETLATPFSEASPAGPRTPYARSKWEAEQALRELCGDGMELVVLRFPLVYGPGAPGNFSRLVGLVRSRLPLPLGSIRNQRNLLYVENAADALVAAAEHPRAAGELFLVADREQISTPELVREIARNLGRGVVLFPTSRPLIEWAGSLLGATVGLVTSLLIDTRRIHSLLGWTPPFTLQEGLRRSLRPREVSPPASPAAPPPPAGRAAAGNTPG